MFQSEPGFWRLDIKPNKPSLVLTSRNLSVSKLYNPLPIMVIVVKLGKKLQGTKRYELEGLFILF